MEFSIMRRVGTEWNRTIIFISLFFCQFQHIMAWNETTMVFWNFLNFIAIFLEFSITIRVRTKRNYNFYFLSFTAFSNLFWLEMKPQRYFLIFWLLYWNFLLYVGLERNGTERNDNFYFLAFPSFSNLFWLKMNP